MKLIDKKPVLMIKTFGNSMFPLLTDQDIVTVEKINFKSVKVNDLVTFKRKGNFVTHRVLYVSPSRSYLITKGDNNVYEDSRVYPRDFLGKVVAVKRQGQTFDPESVYLYQSTIYFQEIVKIKKLLEKNKIRFVFLKGLPIHLLHEKVHPRRFYLDCDILIDPKDYAKVNKILTNQQYFKENTSLTKFHKHSASEISYSKIVNHIKVTFDIHLEAVFLMTQLRDLNLLYPQSTLKAFSENLLDEKIEVEILGNRFPILNRENLIIYLILHIFHHNFKGYNRYQLLLKVLASKKISYQKISQKIHEFKLNNFIFPVLMLAQKYYSLKLPRDFLISLKPKEKIRKLTLQKLLKENIFSEQSRLDSGIKRFRLIFDLSPNPTPVKLMIVFNREVLVSFVWVFVSRLKILTFRNYLFR